MAPGVKSDFTLARSCPRKLQYKKAGYSSNISDNEYIKFLADAGFAIGKMAQLMYPDGITINSKGRLEETKNLLQKQAVVLFLSSYN